MGILFEKIPYKEGIRKYITYFSGREDSGFTDTITQEKLSYILRYWSKEKSQYLYKMLGNQFILEIPIEYERPYDEMFSRVRNGLRTEVMRTFASNFTCWAEDYAEKNGFTYSERYALLELVTPRVLTDGEVTNPNRVKVAIGDKTVTIQKGSKPSKMLGKIASLVGIEGYEPFRLEYSRIFNLKKLKGTLCISIHPLDYMTLSDNDYNWKSCMNWIHEGEFRLGTVEMMNSTNVVVCYLKGEDPFRVYDIEWSDKKWRNLFIVDKNIISGVKGYPYQSEELDKICLEKLRELAKVNLGWEYGPIINKHFCDPYTTIKVDVDNEIELEFETNFMYNDFGNDSWTHLMFGVNLPVNARLSICYSGVANCMNCGEEIYGEVDAQELLCGDCLQTVYCECCEGKIRGESYELDDLMLCEDCYFDNRVYDPIDECYHYNGNCSKLYLISGDTNFKDWVSFKKVEPRFIWIYNLDSVDWEEKKIDHGYWYEWIKYIRRDKCSDELYNIFMAHGEEEY